MSKLTEEELNRQIDRLIELAKVGNIVQIQEMFKDSTTDKKLVNRLDRKHGKNGFLIACEDGTNDIVEFLIARKAQVNIRGGDSLTPAMLASSSGMTDTLVILNKHRADFSLVDNKGNHCIHLAAHRGHTKTIEYILGVRNAVDVQNNALETALTICLKNEHFDSALFLLANQANINIAGMNGNTALCRSAFDGRTETLEFILQHGGDTNLSNFNGETPLMIACKRNLRSIIEKLLSSGSRIDEVDSCGRNGLMFACLMNKLDLAEFLLNLGAPIDSCDQLGSTALILASQNPKAIDIVEHLCRRGADVNFVDRNFNSALSYACAAGIEKSIFMLLQHGADWTNRNIDEKLPVDLIPKDILKKNIAGAPVIPPGPSILQSDAEISNAEMVSVDGTGIVEVIVPKELSLREKVEARITELQAAGRIPAISKLPKREKPVWYRKIK